MQDMTLIAAVDKNWAIGYENDVLIGIPEDRKHFKQLTMGNIIIIGRKTLESFPNGKPLPGRINIVVTKNKEYKAEGVILAYSIEEAVNTAQIIAGVTGMKIFVAGGGEIYRQLKGCCNEAVITYIDYCFENADTFFPGLDSDESWHLVSVSGRSVYENCEFEYRTYKKTEAF